MYSYCYVRPVPGILYHCGVLYIVCFYMCIALLSPGVTKTAVNKYIVSYHIISYHII